MATALTNGYNVIINQKVGSVNTPIYPFTRTANVKDSQGNTLDEIIATLATKDFGNYVPDFTGEEVSNLRFLRNDNTWATIQSASTTQAGVVQLSDSTNTADSTVAATSAAVKAVKDAVDALDTSATSQFVKKTQLGVATDGDNTGVATLDTNGYVPSTQLPSYVDDVLEVSVSEDKTSATNEAGHAVTPESGKIYVDCVGEAPTNNTFRWSGTRFVEISESLAIGTTATTAFDGARGLIAYNHTLAQHARVDATLTEASETNGYIKVNGSDVLVYTHPQAEGASATNPHGTTAADVGLGKVENKTATEILAELTSANVAAALGYTAADSSVLATASNSGMMSASYAKKADQTLESAISTEAPTFDGTGIWFQIVSSDAVAGA